MLNRTSLPTMFVAAALVLGTFVACSSSSSDAPSTPQAGFCDALSAAYGKCAGGDSCGPALSADCTKLAGILSAPILSAATSCVQSTACGTDPLSCLGGALAKATPSAAQTKLAADYCESCSVVGGDPCTTAFYGAGSVPGLGLALLPFGDGPLDQIDSSCTSSSLGKTACQAAFTTCLTTTTTKFLATSVSADSAKCLIDGIKNGLAGAGAGADGSAPAACKDCAGCCQDGACQTGDKPAACGGGGGACETCQGAAACTGGKCITTCGPDNCAGCCDASGACQTIDAVSACGSGGAACAPCAGGAVCTKGQCIDPGCKASCASGCCTAAGCQTGSATNACGTGGNACATCGSAQACTGGACILNGGALFDFVAVGARVPTLDLSGSSWDAFSGLPDPYLKATSGAAAGAVTYRADTLTPVWNEVALSGLSATALKADLKIQVYDSDTAFDDFMGGCTVTLNGSEFDGALHTVSCPASATGVALSVDYRLKAH